LLTLEAANKSESDADGKEVPRVFEKLRASLTEFVGEDGFTALLRRALVLARADVPSLQTAEITPDGRLEGLQEPAAGARKDVEAATAITSHLLGLLVTFVGEAITLRLVRNVWPDESSPTIIESEDL
jgi:hypothetical protein